MVLLKDENLSPDVITYNAFLNACERARQWQRALVTLEEMQREDLTPDIISFSSAMAACELCARWDLALTLLSQARAAKLDLTLAACSTAVSACAQGRKWRWAMRLFEAARPLGLDVTIFCACLSACGRAGHWELSLHLLEEMGQSRMEPDKVTCAAAVAACELSAEPRHALRLLAGTEQRAAEWERVCGRQKAVSSTPIVLRVTSPQLITLTLVDLPGIARVPVGDQPEDIEKQLRQLIFDHISKPNCLILAVAAANADLATADSLALAREVDPRGERTLGVLTKMDLAGAAANEAAEVLQGNVYPLSLGFVGVMCKENFDHEVEQQFFSQHPVYKGLAPHCTVQHLAKRLNRILLEKICEVLPGIRAQVNVKQNETLDR
eukprot:symbB.v1.2.022786.t2/scaffold2040.1/size91418/2